MEEEGYLGNEGGKACAKEGRGSTVWWSRGPFTAGDLVGFRNSKARAAEEWRELTEFQNSGSEVWRIRKWEIRKGLFDMLVSLLRRGMTI